MSISGSASSIPRSFFLIVTVGIPFELTGQLEHCLFPPASNQFPQRLRHRGRFGRLVANLQRLFNSISSSHTGCGILVAISSGRSSGPIAEPLVRELSAPPLPIGIWNPHHNTVSPNLRHECIRLARHDGIHLMTSSEKDLSALSGREFPDDHKQAYTCFHQHLQRQW